MIASKFATELWNWKRLGKKDSILKRLKLQNFTCIAENELNEVFCQKSKDFVTASKFTKKEL